MDNPLYAVTQLAQTTMRSELGKLTLDETFLERESLNVAITKVLFLYAIEPNSVILLF